MDQTAEVTWGSPNTLTAAGYAQSGTGGVQLFWRDETAGTGWNTVAYQAIPGADTTWSNEIAVSNRCHTVRAYVNYAGIRSADFVYNGVTSGFCTETVSITWVQPQSTAGYGPPGSLMVAGSAKNAPASTVVYLLYRDVTAGTGWIQLAYAPITDSNDIWINPIENANPFHVYQVQVNTTHSLQPFARIRARTRLRGASSLLSLVAAEKSMRKLTVCLTTVCFVLVNLPVFAQTTSSTSAQTMTVDEYEPRSGLVVPQHPLTRAKYPFIDVHTHYDVLMPRQKLDELVAELDRINLKIAVDLSGGSGTRLAAGVKNMKGAYQNRFVIFANLNYEGIDDPDYGQKAAARLEQDVKNGAQGLKIFKQHGLEIKDSKGARIPTNDSRFDPIWEKCAALRIPVLIHTGEPRQFFEPPDRFNERWLELKQYPGRARPPDRYPSWEPIMGEQHDLFAKHPAQTLSLRIWIGWVAI